MQIQKKTQMHKHEIKQDAKSTQKKQNTKTQKNHKTKKNTNNMKTLKSVLRITQKPKKSLIEKNECSMTLCIYALNTRVRYSASSMNVPSPNLKFTLVHIMCRHTAYVISTEFRHIGTVSI
jgi:hypothetical protein